jgi:hypothetical protein
MFVEIKKEEAEGRDPWDTYLTTAKVLTKQLRIPSFRYKIGTTRYNFGTTEREEEWVSDP